MISSSACLVAWLVYILATLSALLVLNRWMRGGVRLFARATVLAGLAGLALAPAPPGADLDSWAPAVIVALFNLPAHGLEASLPALRSLVIGVSAGLGLGVLAVFLYEPLSREPRRTRRELL